MYVYKNSKTAITVIYTNKINLEFVGVGVCLY